MIDLGTDPMAALRKRQGEATFETENYVSSPPALWIVEPDNTCWTLGFNAGEAPSGEFAFNVLRDGVNTGAFASRIESRNGRVRCFTKDGWKVWSGRSWF